MTYFVWCALDLWSGNVGRRRGVIFAIDRSGCENSSSFAMGVKFEADLFDGVSDFLDGVDRLSNTTLPVAPLFEVFSAFEKIDFKTVTLVLSFSVKFVRLAMFGRLTFMAVVISPLLFRVFLLSSFFLNSILAKVTPLVGHEEEFDGATTIELFFTNIPATPALERLPR